MSCEYFDLSIKNSNEILNCNGENVCNNSKFYNLEKDTTRINNIYLQRGRVDYNIDDYNIDNSNNSIPAYNKSSSSLIDKELNRLNFINNNEGFTNFVSTDNGSGIYNLGNKCPEGYSLDINGNCIQKCINCKYNDKDKNKSVSMNESDPCFPNGIYNGRSNDGDIRCTCGDNNQYCSNKFIKKYTVDGMLLNNNNIMMNIGITDYVGKLFNYDYL